MWQLLSMVLCTIYTCWVQHNEYAMTPWTQKTLLKMYRRWEHGVGAQCVRAWSALPATPPNCLAPAHPSQPTYGKFWICYWIHYHVNLSIWCGGQECDNSHDHKNWEDKTIKPCIPCEEIPEIIFIITVSSFNEMYKIKNILRNLNFQNEYA